MSGAPDLLDQLRTDAESMGARAFGVADVEQLKRQTPDLLDRVPGDFPRAVIAGIRLQDAVLEGIEDRPTPLYFHNYRQLNYRLDRLALRLADLLQEAGHRALAVPASQIIERNPMRGHVSHRLLGYAAGPTYECYALVDTGTRITAIRTHDRSIPRGHSIEARPLSPYPYYTAHESALSWSLEDIEHCLERKITL